MLKNYQKTLREVLREIQPTNDERVKLESLSGRTLQIANEYARKMKGKAIIAGSLTRNTWLPHKNEFDVFIILPKSITEKNLEKIGLKFGKGIIKKLGGKHRIEYAQHPYVRGFVDETQIDIVPCYEMMPGERIKSAVDRTPFHVDYLNKNLKEDMSDDVRLLKQFCFANKIYGADTKTEGFSGYVCELLVIKYGKFLDVLKNVAKWQPGEIIDIENYYDKKDYHELKKQFKRQVLIVIDPTDKTRNAAAAISANSFYMLKKMTNVFLTDPSEEFFFEEKYDTLTEHELISLLMKRRTEVILVVFRPPKVVPDILWPQLRRFSDRLEQILKEYEFIVHRKDIYTDEKDLAVVLLEMEVSKLPAIDKKIGPLIFDLDDSERFLNKYKKIAITGPFIENDFWCVEVKRIFMAARDKLFESLEEKAKILKAKGIPNHIADEITKKFEIISETEKIMELIKKDEKFGIFLRRYFTKGSLV
jgi:tRNA nucleotidyltransferase (CCA-adding enzyme)